MKKNKLIISAMLMFSLFLLLNSHVFAEMNATSDDFPDGDPSIGVPQVSKAYNYELVTGVDLIEYDKITGEKIADYTARVPDEEASAVEKQEKVMQLSGKIDQQKIRFRSGFSICPERGFSADLLVSDGRVQANENDYLLVQFGDEVKKETMDMLKESGARFFDYVPYHAFYIRAPDSLLPQLALLVDKGDIRYVGPIPAEAKIEPALLYKVVNFPEQTYEVAVQLFKGQTDAIASYLDAFEEIYSQTARAVIGKLDGKTIQALYAEPFVRWVEEWFPPQLQNLEGRMINGVDMVAHLGGFTGDGVNVATMDTGIAQSGSTYHPDLPASRVSDQWDYQNNDSVANDDYANGHGTHVAGSLGGEGNHDTAWLGMAPESNLHIYKLCCGTGQFSWFEDALNRADDNTVRVINNSWGGGNHGEYNSNAELADEAVRAEFGHYMNLVVASGNDADLVNSPASAKNVITVGAVKDGNWPNSTINVLGHIFYVWPPGQIAPFSNYGPIDCDSNGHYRIKPDVVSTGPRTMSTVPWYLPAGLYYDLLDGTSMAAPKVTGMCALFLEAYPEYETWPEMVKARMIASAINIGSSNTYGHGLVDASHFIYTESGVMENVLNVTSSVENNADSKIYTFTVPSGFQEVRAVLTWPDPPGMTEAINDLDVYLRDADGSTRASSSYYDHVVEKAIATTGTPGTWEVEVDPYDLGSPAQYFALTVYVVMAPPSLDLNAWSEKRWVKPGEYFYFYTQLENGGSSAPATYVTLDAPNGTIFDVQGGRLYPAEGHGRSEYYYDSDIHAHSDPVQNQYSMATGTVTTATTPLVRWFVRVDPGTTWNGNAQFYTRGYAFVGGSTTQKSVLVGVDDTAPSGSVQINGGAAQTTSLLVTLNLSAADNLSGVTQMQFSNDGSSWSGWESYNTTRTNWNLSAYGGNSLPGTKTTYVQFKDAAGNVSSTYTDNIMYSPALTCECDLNDDGSCNILDWPYFIEDWGRTDCNNPGVDCECDMNGDGSCNILDWPYFIEDWGRTDCP